MTWRSRRRREAELTADHDGLLVADVVAEWAPAAR
jgi:hypothetical protein